MLLRHFPSCAQIEYRAKYRATHPVSEAKARQAARAGKVTARRLKEKASVKSPVVVDDECAGRVRAIAEILARRAERRGT